MGYQGHGLESKSFIELDSRVEKVRRRCYQGDMTKSFDEGGRNVERVCWHPGQWSQEGKRELSAKNGKTRNWVEQEIKENSVSLMESLGMGWRWESEGSTWRSNFLNAYLRWVPPRAGNPLRLVRQTQIWWYRRPEYLNICTLEYTG